MTYLDPAIVRRMWPRAPQKKIDTVCRLSAEVFAEHDIDDWNVVAELMGNISHENGAGTIVRENGNYRAPRINEIFGPARSSAKVSPEEAERLAGDPVALFNRVYGPHPLSPKLTKTLGNTEPGDGYKFRGGGDLQLTGRYNYERIGKLTGYPQIIDNPDLMANPEISFRVAVAEFAKLGCIPLAAKGQSTAVRVRINGGKNGLSDTLIWVKKWKAALPQIPTVIEEEVELDAPRGADTGSKSLISSKIVQSAIGTAASTAIGTGAKLAENGNTTTEKVPTVDLTAVTDKLAQASDTITTVSIAKDSATAIITQVKPFLGVSPGIWGYVAVGFGVAALCFVAWTIYERYARKRDTGE